MWKNNNNFLTNPSFLLTVHHIKHDLILGKDMPETRCQKMLIRNLD